LLPCTKIDIVITINISAIISFANDVDNLYAIAHIK
jgi:hypothetical protein